VTMAHKTSGWRYVAVWGALCVLTFATYGLHDLIGGREPWSLIVAMAIAVVKSALVALFFMELWEHKGANRFVFAVSLAFVLLLMGFTIADVKTRYPLAVPPRQAAVQKSGPLTPP
jgi:cytochrome c oxidase subunit IV